MTVTITYESILKDIKRTSQMEMANVADPDARYRAEAGTEKEARILRCVTEAVSLMRLSCHDFEVSELINGTTEADDADSVAPRSYTFSLEAGERRLEGKSKTVATLLHENIVNLAMQRFYVSVSQPSLANAHGELAAAASKNLDAALHTKRRPRPLAHTNEPPFFKQ